MPVSQGCGAGGADNNGLSWAATLKASGGSLIAASNDNTAK